MSYTTRMRKDATDVVTPWRHRPAEQLRTNARGLARCFYPHDGNNNFRKFTTVVLFGLWGSMTLGVSPAPSREVYLAFTVLCFTILGQQWELEKLRILGTDIGTGRDSSGDDGGDD